MFSKHFGQMFDIFPFTLIASLIAKIQRETHLFQERIEKQVEATYDLKLTS